MEKMVTMQQDELLCKKYSNIGVLHLPKSLRIEMQYESPFATYEQRPFVCAAPTKCFKVQISEIDNQSDYITLKDGVLYSKDMSRSNILLAGEGIVLCSTKRQSHRTVCLLFADTASGYRVA